MAFQDLTVEDRQFKSFTLDENSDEARRVLDSRSHRHLLDIFNALTVDVFGSTGNLGSALDSVVDFDNSFGYSTGTVKVVVPTGGRVNFEGSIDGIEFFAITARSFTTNDYIQFTDSDANIIISIEGLKTVRFRTSIGGSANGTILGRVSFNQSVLEGIEHSAPPHKFGEVIQRRDFSTTTIQTGTVIWTPESNKRFVVTDWNLIVSGTADGRLKVFDETDSQGNYLINGFFDVTQNSPIFLSSNLVSPFISSTVGNRLRITTTEQLRVDIILHGFENFAEV